VIWSAVRCPVTAAYRCGCDGGEAALNRLEATSVFATISSPEVSCRVGAPARALGTAAALSQFAARQAR
jgi:hypothetical protein